MQEEDEEKMSQGEGHSKQQVSYGYHMVHGKMGQGMEDYVVAKIHTLRGTELDLYAIFDGHSGHGVAEYLKHNLFHEILNQVRISAFPDFFVPIMISYLSNECNYVSLISGKIQRQL